MKIKTFKTHNKSIKMGHIYNFCLRDGMYTGIITSDNKVLSLNSGLYLWSHLQLEDIWKIDGIKIELVTEITLSNE